LAGLFRKTRDLFANVEYATTQIPTYPCGQIGFLMCSAPGAAAPATAGASSSSTSTAAPPPSCKVPVRRVPAGMKLEYYSSELHSASFVLPAFMRRTIDAVVAERQQPHQQPPAAAAPTTAART